MTLPGCPHFLTLVQTDLIVALTGLPSTVLYRLPIQTGHSRLWVRPLC